MKIFSWTAPKEQRGRRLDHVLRAEYGLSSRQIIRLKRQLGTVLVNGHSVPVVSRLGVGDHVQIAMEEHLDPVPPEPIPLDIIYEDQDLAIVNKQAGLVSHPTKGYSGGTLANALSYHWQQRGEQHPARLVTRLDKETSGLVLVAKTAWSHYRLAQTDVYKEYLAITRGIPDPPEGEITAPLGRDSLIPTRRGIDPGGKEAVTKYRVQGAGNGLALVRLWPITGRTHQLRLHLAHIGCPIIDDFMYGEVEGIVGRTALHAYCLRFPHPGTNKDLAFTAELPEDMSII